MAVLILPNISMNTQIAKIDFTAVKTSFTCMGINNGERRVVVGLEIFCLKVIKLM